MKVNSLIIGFGKMGHRYSKHLNELGVQWDFYDPYVPGGLESLQKIDQYTHVFVSTPPENHFDSYEKIKKLGFNGYIYIDKPVFISKDNLDCLNDEKIFCGMTERYNPAILKLKELIDVEKIVSLRFSRCSVVPFNIKTPILFDLGIHDLDLYLDLLNFNELPNIYDVFKKSRTCCAMAKQDDILSVFEWSHESFRRERKVTVRQKNAVYEADLIDQTITSYKSNCRVESLYVAKSQPLKEIVVAFLRNDVCKATLSHNFMLDII